MGESIREERTWYLDPERGWSREETDGSLVRLISRRAARVAAVAENILERRGAGGAWTPLEAEDALEAPERGWMIEYWPIGRDGEPLVAFRSLRVVDTAMADGVLAGLTLRDIDTGAPLDSPVLAGHSFALSADEGEALIERLRSLGARLRVRPADAGALSAQADAIAEARGAVDELLIRMRAALGHVAAGDLASAGEVGRIEMDVHRRADAVGRLLAEGEAVRAAATRGGIAPEERVTLEHALARIAADRAAVDEHRAEAREIARAAARIAGTAPESLAALEPGLSDALAIVAAHLGGNGVAVRLEDGQLTMRSADGAYAVRLGRSVEVRPVSSK